MLRNRRHASTLLDSTGEKDRDVFRADRKCRGYIMESPSFRNSTNGETFRCIAHPNKYMTDVLGVFAIVRLISTAMGASAGREINLNFSDKIIPGFYAIYGCNFLQWSSFSYMQSGSRTSRVSTSFAQVYNSQHMSRVASRYG